MPTGVEDIRRIVRMDKKQGQRLLVISAILLVALCIVILCFDYELWIDEGTVQWVSPLDAFRGIFYKAKLQILYWLGMGDGAAYANTWSIIQALPNEAKSYNRLLQVILTGVSGAVLALSGAVYQSAMRNPMAVSTMLGVTSSVNMAKMLVLFYVGIDALTGMTWQLYALSYGLSAIVLLIILAAGKLAGGKHVSVVDMLLAGTIMNRLIQTYVNYLRDQLDEDTLMAYQELNERAYDVFGQLQNLGVLLIVSLLIMTPILLMRFSYNAISFEDDDARCLGISPNAMRVYAMVAGAILTTAAMIHYGNIGTLALIVPHICRYTFGTEFRRVVTTSAFFGAFLLIIGWFVSNFTWMGDYQIPVGSILSLIVMPVLLWFSFRQRRGWE
ncbi:MAG: iron ABC transporter permease [Oscillospiraceae bacterium]|nr:iron ABC transporter permease [Oscillospiraceae bacterium]